MTHAPLSGQPQATLQAGEHPVSTETVHALLRQQFPPLAALPLRPVVTSGTSHVLFRLGDRLVVRLPRTHGAAQEVEKLHRWLPVLAPGLPLSVPAPQYVGTPSEDFPFTWSIEAWIDAEPVSADTLAASEQAARDLGRFVRALRGMHAAGGPPAGEHSYNRGGPLKARDGPTRTALAQVAGLGLVDTGLLAEAWQTALGQPPHVGPPAWLHGDLIPGNLLHVAGRLTAVIDFGVLCVGDPACDLMAAWTLFNGANACNFRDAAGADAAAWARGRGWALSFAVIALPYYLPMGHPLAGIAQRTLQRVSDEWRGARHGE